MSIFQSTRPVRGATITKEYKSVTEIFQSTRPVRGATRMGANRLTGKGISIHAPRAGRDSGGLPPVGGL